MSNWQTYVSEQNAEVHSSENANHRDEHLAEPAPSLFIGDKVTEAHHQVEGDQGDDLVKRLDVSIESGTHGFTPVE